MMPSDSHFSSHDHTHCISRALAQAEQHCRQAGLRLTPLRRRVLELVWQSHVPVGAYDLLAVLGQDGYCSAPPTVYRALDFLLEQHLIHRIARTNGFIGCTHPGHPHDGTFLLCRGCGRAVEMQDQDVAGIIRQAAARQGFRLETLSMEADGWCADCQPVPAEGGHDHG